jgi:hypothetical protein
MKKVTIITLAVVILIIALAAFVLQGQIPSYQFKAEQDNVEFYSNEMDPFDHLRQLSAKQDFLLVLSVKEAGDEINPIMGQALNELTVILVANGKNVTTLAKSFDASNQLTYCQTNRGDIHTSDQISVEECGQMLSQLGNQVLIEINPPNYLLGKSRVVLAPNQIKLQPKDKNDVTRVPHILLLALYPQTNEIINQVNQTTQNVIDSMSDGE